MDVSKYEGFELLTDAERRLCSEMHMEPRHWLVVKEHILKILSERGVVTADTAQQAIRLGEWVCK